MTVDEPSFTPELFTFLRDLAANNTRDWFTANKERYVAEVQEPALAFVEDVGVRLPEVSRHLVADPRPTGATMTPYPDRIPFAAIEVIVDDIRKKAIGADLVNFGHAVWELQGYALKVGLGAAKSPL